MVARRSPSDSADASNVEALRDSLAERDAEVEELRAQIVKSAAAEVEFLSEAAHAIRNPLTVTLSYLDILNSDLREGLTEEQQSFLTIAYENAERLRRLIDDLVDLAAFEAGTAQIELASVCLTEVFDSLQSECQSTAEHDGLSFAIDVSEPPLTAVIDQKRLEDVLRRLLDNAFRFTPAGGEVSVRATRDQGWVTIDVIDSGLGIPADCVDSSFQAFVQLHRKPGENRERYGLGLPLCRRMVEAFGGTLDLTSAEGRGTTATIRIPVSRHE